ncbi:MAG: amidohydrolase family protein [Bradyrhizobium sp.]|uniref:amidohydrolase family protein n=1 Tax=Bradyrhizobium sp. TaxID=376 RepID=UPI001DF27BBF|nr:amidohydrolase family protein [Bradyrhizobium sp.]MBV9565215.1 amidohydrolase family protein [Bradyrhizobium sp.]
MTMMQRIALFAIAMCWLTPGVRPSAAATVEDVWIEHVTVVSPERASPLRDAEVDIHDGRIVSITTGGSPGQAAGAPSTVTTIDGTGLYLAPGLIDSHVHLGAIPGMTNEQEARHPDIAQLARDQIPRSYLLYGFTTLVDLISSPQGMARWKDHDVVPDTYFCGGASLMDGYPMNYRPKAVRYRAFPYMLVEPDMAAPPDIAPEMHTPAAVVARMKADGAICVKTFYEHGFGTAHDLPVPKAETIRELVQAAHAAGMPVLMHASSIEAQSFGLGTGVDIMAHGLWNWNDPSRVTDLTPAAKALLDDVLAKNVGWQPTIQVLYGERDLFNTAFLSDPLLARVLPSGLIDWYRSPEGQWLHDAYSERFGGKDRDPKVLETEANRRYALPIDRVSHAAAYLASHGGRLLFGTDTPSAPTYANPPGLNGWLEMQRLVAAGETPEQIFRSATLSNAQALKLDQDVGTVEVGKRANLLLLHQDPTQTIEAYAGIVKVLLGGRVLDPAELVANRSH